jgi:serine phosphatase RsbU (regulator of sigma subunit)/FixJ family two-component response regulator
MGELGGTVNRKPARILLVEDRTSTLETAAEVLESGGYEVDTAADAREAVARVHARRPDLILIGTAPRGMDRKALATHLKAEPATRDIRIVAWRKPGARGVTERAVEAGSDCSVVEPEDANGLPSAINPCVNAPAASPHPEPGDSICSTRHGGLKILVVDDNALNRAMLAALLSGEGHLVREASDGVAALTLLGLEKIDAVITDALMPMLDGYQLCHRIRRNPRLRDMPVIIFSGTLLSPESEMLAEALGAVRFLRKPAPADAVIAALGEVVMEAEARRIEAEWSEEPKFGPGEKVRRLVEELDRQNRTAQAANEKLLQAHHELLVLSCALEKSEESLRERNAQLEEDMRMARETHFALLPRFQPSFPSGTPPGESALRFHQCFAPKGEVSGDFFDYAALSETNAGVFICDVMGHGVSAALMTAVIRGMLVEFARASHEPGEVLAAINRALVPIMRSAGAPMFASAFYMIADAASGEIRYANAGHPHPFLVRRDLDRVERIGVASLGPALGLMEESRYQSGSRVLVRGDMVMMYTDGIFEVDGPGETLFGKKRLLEAVQKRIHLPLDLLFDELMREVRDYSLTHEFGDDICLLGMEVDHLC